MAITPAPMNSIERPSMTHELKCHPGPFQAVKDGTKPFEWRKDDRDYRVGDTLILREWMPGTGWDNDGGNEGDYTGESVHRTVTYIIREGFGIPDGYCIMGLAIVDHMTKAQQPKRLTEEEIRRITDEQEERAKRLNLRDVFGPNYLVGFSAGLRHARDQGYIGGLTVDEAMEVAEPFIEAEAEMEDGARWNWETKHQKYQAMIMDLRARFASKLSQH